MASLVAKLNEITGIALEEISGIEGVDPLIAPTKNEKHGHYQCNAALSLAKRLGQKPRDLAQQLADKLSQGEGREMFAKIEIAGPGFLNLTLTDGTLAHYAQEAVAPFESDAWCTVVDYSCPNVAKQMHVGHLRSTIIGDAISRILRFMGGKVIRQNHIGDWGTQFGLLCAWLMDRSSEELASGWENVDLSDLEALYRESQALANEDEEFKTKAHQRVVALHTGDKATLDVWRHIISKSLEHVNNTYRFLDVLLTPEDVRGESFYNPMLAPLVQEMQKRFPAGSRPLEVVEDQGAICVFMYDEAGQPLFKNADDQPQPMLIRKSDGAFLYPTTDLAAMRFRVNELNANEIIYVTDARQALHFKMMFTAADMAGFCRNTTTRHITFGSVLGADNKPLKTRAGKNIKLQELLEEAVQKAESVVRETSKNANPPFSDEEIKDIAHAVGIGAVKYADLSQNRISDYVFSFDRMLAMDGNTAPYLMYAYARIRSILRKAQDEELQGDASLTWEDDAETRLVLHLARFKEAIEFTASDWRINTLCDYLYGLAGLYMKFYEHCPVLNAPTPAQRRSRLQLCQLTGQVLKQGLSLLGIRAVERM